MDLRAYASVPATSALALAVLAIAAVAVAAPLALAQDLLPSPSTGPLPDNSSLALAAAPANPPASPLDPILTGGMPATAASGTSASDDRENSTPTAWHIQTRQTVKGVNDTIALGYRLVDIYLEGTSSSHTFTGVYVANSGSYQKDWWWLHGVDETTLSHALSLNNARVISLKAYDIGNGQIHFTAVMISNSGADATSWWWYYDRTPGEIHNLVEDHNARLTQIHAYETGGQTRYAVVMVDNSGAASQAWWWYYDKAPEEISPLIADNHARLVDLDINPVTGNLNVIMNSCTSGCPYWWWYVGIPEGQLLDVLNQNAARVIDVNSYPGCGSTCHDLLLINNSAITTRVGDMLSSGTDGIKGLYLEEVGGPVLANLMNDYVFEPASTLKVAVHLHTIQQIRDDPEISPDTLIPRYPPLVPPSTCPTSGQNGSESIFDADRAMMWRSDNVTTLELVDYFGQENINTTMASTGMTDSSINHVFGCGGPTPNKTTLDDLATLYRRVVSGTLLDGADRALFYLQMAGTSQFLYQGQDWTHLVDTDIPAIIDEEAPPGMPMTLKDTLEADIFLAYKAGDYTICTSDFCATYVAHVSIFGYARIPFCDGGGPRNYLFGLFINDSTSEDDLNAAFTGAKAELLREQIHAGLASCFYQVHLPLVLH